MLAVLERLYDRLERADSNVLPFALLEYECLGGPFDDLKVASFLDNAFIPVAPRLLYVLVRTLRPTVAVEFGTLFGLYAIHIAAALRDNGVGRLIATELNHQKASFAVEHLQQAGFGDLVEVRQGDAFETLSDVTEIGFLLLVGWKALYLAMLQKLEPALKSASLIVVGDLKIMPEMLQPYLTYVRDPENGYNSCELPFDDGLELSLRK
ncbi:MAG: O-methyltransferase [Syntrophobacteraceae bacterium]